MFLDDLACYNSDTTWLDHRHNKVIEQHPHGGKVLLDGWLGQAGAAGVLLLG